MTNTDKIFMSNESDPKIQGVMIKNQTVVLEPKLQQQLNQKGYGEIAESKLLLKSFESLCSFGIWEGLPWFGGMRLP